MLGTARTPAAKVSASQGYARVARVVLVVFEKKPASVARHATCCVAPLVLVPVKLGGGGWWWGGEEEQFELSGERAARGLNLPWHTAHRRCLIGPGMRHAATRAPRSCPKPHQGRHEVALLLGRSVSANVLTGHGTASFSTGSQKKPGPTDPVETHRAAPVALNVVKPAALGRRAG